MRSRKFVLALLLWIRALGLSAAVAEPAAPEKQSFHCSPRFQHPGFADLDDFVQTMQAREKPWDALLQPDKNPNPEYEPSAEIEAPGAWTTEIIYHSQRRAIVFVQYKANRTAPFSALVFLLSKKRERWHVSDFVRRSDYGGYSNVRTPKVLKLRPAEHLHFYFTEYLGGRKLGADTDEFYMVDGNHLHRTLLLKNDGVYISPADPWYEFYQDTTVRVVAGRLRVIAQRTWRLQTEEERKQTFVVTFRWDSRRKKFASRWANKLSLDEPSAWTAKGLPLPPAE